MDTLSEFSIFDKGDDFCDFLFALLYNKIPSEKKSTLEGKNLLPKEVYSRRKEFGSKFFPFRVDPFSEGSKNNF